MKVLACLVGAVVAETDTIIGYNGKQTNGVRHRHHPVVHSKFRSSQTRLHAIRKPVFHHLINSRPLLLTPALDAMQSIATMFVDEEVHHPAIVEMVKVARELVREEDEELARQTLPTFNENLLKLSDLVMHHQLKSTKLSSGKAEAEGPDGAAAKMIADMRANVCGGNPDLHQEKCADFMKQYCSENADSKACAAFYGNPEPETTPAPQPKAKPVAKPQSKKPSQQDVPALPEQGFDGENVAHIDGETSTDDWRKEFGPGQPDTYDSICSKHPNSEWCRLNGYGGLYHGSAQDVAFTGVAATLGLFALI